MSSSEQAPEPTMDEILASIRKIIADDDESSEPAPEAVPHAASEGGAHSGLAGDISSAMGHQEPAGEAEDDIFDLTDQVHEPAPQTSPIGFAPAPAPAQPEYQPQPEADPFASTSAHEVPPIPPVTGEAPLQPESPFASDSAVEPEGVMPHDVSGVLSGAPMEQSSLPESATGFGAVEPPSPMADAAWQAPGEPQQAESPGEAAAEPAGDVMDLDSFVPGQGIGSGDRVEEAFAESDVVAATEAQQQHDEFEQAIGEMAGPAESVPVAEAPEPVIVPPEPEPSFAEAAEARAPELEAEEAVPDAAASKKSLEDSVKEMLRPMLRAWLDDNMPRIVESAVRDELRNKHNQF